MYLRHTRRRKDGKTHVYWQLVRSVRRGRKVVQQTVAQLGELDAEGRARAKALARSIAGRRSECCQGQLFDRAEATGSVAVKLDGVRLERSRSFGVVWLGWILWRALKLDEQCEALLVSKRETVGWAEVIAILVIGRPLCEPSSELHVAEQWYRSTALEDLLGVAVEDIYDERLYRALDRLLPHKQALEKHLVKRLGELFDLDNDLLLYDVTSTYFEGVADPAIAKRGYSRDHRGMVQVNIALVVSREGMPLGYGIFAGNTTDVTTVQQIVEKMEDRFGKVNRVWVMDRGMVSAENISWLNSTGRRYVIGTARAELGRFTQQITEKTDWHQIREDIEVKICRGPDGSETFLLCRSLSRSEKEKAMHERFSQHIEEGLQSLGRRIEKSKKALDRGQASNARSGGYWGKTPGRRRATRSPF